MLLTPGEEAVIDTIKRLVGEAKDVSIEKMVVFGSRVYGYATEDSDLDIAIVVETEEDRKRLVRYLEEKIDYFALGIFVHPVIISKEQYERKRLGREIDRGIVINLVGG